MGDMQSQKDQYFTQAEGVASDAQQRITETQDAYERRPESRVPPSFPMKRGEGAQAKFRRLNLAIDAAGTAIIEESLGFIARAVKVSNYSDRWVYVPEVDDYVPPLSMRIFSLGAGTQNAKVSQNAPSGRGPGTITAGQLIASTWYEDPLGEMSAFVNAGAGSAGSSAGVIEVPNDAMSNANAGQDVNARILAYDTGAAVWKRVVLKTPSQAGGAAITDPVLLAYLTSYDAVGNQANVTRTGGRDGETASFTPLITVGGYIGGGLDDRLRTPNVFKPQNALAIAAEATIWTPTAGKKFRLMGGWLVQSAAGNILLRDGTAGAIIAVIPSLAGGTAMPFLLGNGILSAVANNLLTATGAAASTLSGIVYGTEE